MIDNIKLTGINAVKGYKADQHNKKSSSSSSSKSSAKNVTLSQQGKAIEQLLNSSEPKTQEKVEAIKAAIHNGEYEINMEKLVDAIVEHYQ